MISYNSELSTVQEACTCWKYLCCVQHSWPQIQISTLQVAPPYFQRMHNSKECLLTDMIFLLSISQGLPIRRHRPAILEQHSPHTNSTSITSGETMPSNLYTISFFKPFRK
ncbi:TPA: hypothetical protein ACH3X1_011018 [Trebouxia sp. C0004]